MNPSYHGIRQHYSPQRNTQDFPSPPNDDIPDRISIPLQAAKYLTEFPPHQFWSQRICNRRTRNRRTWWISTSENFGNDKGLLTCFQIGYSSVFEGIPFSLVLSTPMVKA